MSFKNKNIVRSFPFFTHFACLPFVSKDLRASINALQKQITQIFTKFEYKGVLRPHNHLLCHCTLLMLTLKRTEVKEKLYGILKQMQPKIKGLLNDLQLIPGKVKYFERKNKQKNCQEVTVIYLELLQNKSLIQLKEFIDFLVRILLKEEIIVEDQLKHMHIDYNHKTGKFNPSGLHITLFRANDILVNENFLKVQKQICSLQNKIVLKCQNLEISTMMQYRQDQFYSSWLKIQRQ